MPGLCKCKVFRDVTEWLPQGQPVWRQWGELDIALYQAEKRGKKRKSEVRGEMGPAIASHLWFFPVLFGLPLSRARVPVLVTCFLRSRQCCAGWFCHQCQAQSLLSSSLLVIPQTKWSRLLGAWLVPYPLLTGNSLFSTQDSYASWGEGEGRLSPRVLVLMYERLDCWYVIYNRMSQPKDASPQRWR